MNICKCGCGLKCPSGQVYFNLDHKVRYGLLHPKKRVGNYSNNHKKCAEKMREPLKKLLEDKGHPNYISRINFTLDLQERGITYPEKEIKFYLSALLPSMGYKRRNRHSYQKEEINAT